MGTQSLVHLRKGGFSVLGLVVESYSRLDADTGREGSGALSLGGITVSGPDLIYNRREKQGNCRSGPENGRFVCV